MAAVVAWVTVTMTIIFQLIKHTIGLRVSEEEERMGLDKPEHGLSAAYADFMPVIPSVLGTRAGESIAKTLEPAAIDSAVPVTTITVGTPDKAAADGHEIHKVVIVAKQSRFEALKKAMNDIGITGMTVANVIGCGLQKGAAEYYRGAEVDMTLLPKMKMEIVVSEVPVALVIKTAKEVLYTGHIGDGKIFVYSVENVVKVRTGEEGFAALQDIE